MALFEPHPSPEDEEFIGSDAATRALSVTVVENDFVARVYENIAWFYDFTFGPALHPGRMHAIQRMGIKPGDRVLEVGVGTGINAALYPRDCAVTGIDLSGSDAREGARTRRPQGRPQRPAARDGRRRPQVRRRHASTSSTRRTSSASCPIRSRSRARCAASAVPAAASSSSTTSAARAASARGSSG